VLRNTLAAKTGTLAGTILAGTILACKILAGKILAGKTQRHGDSRLEATAGQSSVVSVCTPRHVLRGILAGKQCSSSATGDDPAAGVATPRRDLFTIAISPAALNN
jgi:hypothetical protein